jgi:hypothetical protein
VAFAEGLDPLAYLYARSTVEEGVIRTVLKRGAEMKAKRRKQEIESIGIATGNALARIFKA